MFTLVSKSVASSSIEVEELCYVALGVAMSIILAFTFIHNMAAVM
jgi:hypothetical protein